MHVATRRSIHTKKTNFISLISNMIFNNMLLIQGLWRGWLKPTQSFKYEALKLVPHTCENCDSEFPGMIFPDCRRGEHPFWPQTKTAHCASGLGLLAASTAEWTHWTASRWTGMETLRQRRIRQACNQAGGRREAQLTFRDIVTVQQAGVRVNVVLWAQRKESRRSRGETHC